MSNPAPAPSSVEPTSPPGWPARLRRAVLPLLWLLPVAALGWVGWHHWQSAQREVWRGEVPLAFDPQRPDALIESESLAALPRDLLRVPLLRDLLSEDFVFYYEGNADRLGVVGALRRIAYEHRLELGDHVVAELLDQPSQLALWRSPDGRLDHALLSLRRGALASALELLAPVAQKDAQLQQVTNLEIDGQRVPVYRLRFGWQRALLFAGHGERLRVLVSPRLVSAHGDLDEAYAILSAALAQDELALPARFALHPSSARHRLVLSADYLALGYGRLLPQLAGLRFELRGSQWQSFVALNEVSAAELDFDALWKAAPIGAAACAAVPVSADTLQALLRAFERRDALPEALVSRLGGPAAVCWYPNSRLLSPLLISRLQPPPGKAAATATDPAALDAALATAFETYIGNPEREASGKRWPVRVLEGAGGPRWQRAVASNFGLLPRNEAGDGEPKASPAFFRVALARHGEHLLFSLDARLVEQAQATLERRYPPLAEQLPRGPVPLYLAPAHLAELAEQEALAGLPMELQPVFHNAAQAHLLPKLKAAAGHAPLALRLDETRADSAWSWQAVRWESL